MASGPIGPLMIRGPAEGSRRAVSDGLWVPRDCGTIVRVQSR